MTSEVLAGLRRARRANRAAGVDVFDAFYQAYLTGIACAVGVLLASDAVGDHRVGPAAVARVGAHGPAVLGLGIVLLAGAGLRSGLRGGPLVLTAADVRHVLLAPVPREEALRPPAWRQLRFAGFAGAVAGATLGVLASHRLPGHLLAWAACGAAAGALTGALVTGAALCASGARLGRAATGALGLGLIGWAAADVALGARTSPTTLLGEVALWPVRFRAAGVGGAVLPVATALAGVVAVGGLSVEAAERRASLASQIRFALTLQDLRTVVLLRRQLTQERPRSRPWVRTPALSRGRALVWRRDLRGLARWPAARGLRVVFLGAAAGAALVGVWKGTTVLLVAAALALFLVGLDALEPLAQEVDHPDRPGSAPIETGRIRLAHVPVPLATVLLAVLAGWGTAIALGHHTALTVGAPLVVSATVLTVAGAATSIVMGAPAPTEASSMLPVEMVGVKMIWRALWAPALVALGLTPLLQARSIMTAPKAGTTPAGAAISGTFLPLMVGIITLAWLRHREQVHAWLDAGRQPK